MSNSKKKTPDCLEHISFKKQLHRKNRKVRNVREMISAATTDLMNMNERPKTYSTHGRSGFASFCEKKKKIRNGVSIEELNEW